jgi:hypothetical protein
VREAHFNGESCAFSGLRSSKNLDKTNSTGYPYQK